MSEEIAVELSLPDGDPLRISWSIDRLAELELGAVGGEPAWRLVEEPDWGGVDALRLLSGRLEDEHLIAIAALRPRGACGHGDELVAGALGGEGAVDELDRVFLSTEYGPDGTPRRIGLELYLERDGLPLRIAADRTAAALGDAGDAERHSTALALRATAASGAAVLDVLRPR